MEVEIKRLKSLGLEDYRVRKAVAMDRWVMGVWHVELERIRAMLSGMHLFLFKVYKRGLMPCKTLVIIRCMAK